MPTSTRLPYTTLFRSEPPERTSEREQVEDVAQPRPEQIGRRHRERGLDDIGHPLEHRGVERVALGVPRAELRDLFPRELGIRSEEHTSELQSLRHLVCPRLHAFPTRRSSDLSRRNARPSESRLRTSPSRGRSRSGGVIVSVGSMTSATRSSIAA